jgi:hypothetical protein
MLKLLSFILKAVSNDFALQKIKKKAVLVYLKSLQAARKSLLFAFLLFLLLQMMILGFIGATATGIWLLPIEELSTRLWVLFGSFFLLFIIPLILLICAFSEKFWFKISGASELLNARSRD